MNDNTLQDGLDAQAKALREFGYPVTVDDVRACYARWKRGESSKDIVQRFCDDTFEKHPRIFGRPDQ